MATRFAQQFTRTAAPGLIRQFGETVTYYSGGTGAGREISAMIDRKTAVISEAGVMGLATVIRVADDSTTGISSTEIDTGRDLVGVALRVGESQQRRQIVRVESTENGLVRFQVQ